MLLGEHTPPVVLRLVGKTRRLAGEAQQLGTAKELAPPKILKRRQVQPLALADGTLVPLPLGVRKLGRTGFVSQVPILPEVTLPDARHDQPYSQQLDACWLGQDGLTFTLEAGTLPPGLVLTPTGLVTGTPE